MVPQLKKSIFDWNSSSKPIIALAPMAGITDQPFRIMCKKYGVDVVFSEMVSSDAIWHKKKITSNKLQITNKSQITNNKTIKSLDIEKLNIDNCLGFGVWDLKLNSDLLKTLNLIKFSQIERPFIVQIFGANPEHMAYAAKYISTGEWTQDYSKITSSKLQITNKSQISNNKNHNSLDIEKLNIDNCLGPAYRQGRFGVWDLEFMSIPDGIDINMGCPARDIIKQGAGSALMKDYKQAEKIIKAVKKSTPLPVSVKTRLGWSDPNEILEFSKVIESAGADALTIHGRTYKQGFVGKPNWDMIDKVKKQIKIPVILNGGINSVEDYNKIKLDKIDGVMIGRGALGRPWIFEEIKNCPPPARCLTRPAKLFIPHSFSGVGWRSGKDSSEVKEVAGNFNSQFLNKIIIEHAELVEKLNGERGIIDMRKHLAAYYKGIPDSKHIREQLVKVTSLEEIKKILK